MFRKKFRAVTAVSSVTSAAAEIGFISIFHVSAVCFQPIVAQITINQSLARLQRQLPDTCKQQTHGF